MIKNHLVVNEELPADEWKRRFEKEHEKNVKLRKKLAQIELGATEPKSFEKNTPTPAHLEMSDVDTTPDTLPQPSRNAQPLVSHLSMPCLLPQVTDECEECQRYKQDLNRLYQQLDDKEDELDDRSREILSLESHIRDLERTQETLHQNTTVISTEYRELDKKYQDAQEELRSMLLAIDELSQCYSDKDSESASMLREVSSIRDSRDYLETELERTRAELKDLKLRHDKHKSQTLRMLRSLFNDLHDQSGLSSSGIAGVLQRSGLYQSSPNLNIDLTTKSCPATMTNSFSAHEGFVQFGSKTDLLDSNIITSSSSEDSSELPSPDLHSPPPTVPTIAFKDRVTELRARLGDILERDYNILSDTSNYARTVKMKRSRPKTGRVFTVLSRARGIGSNSHDHFVPVQLGRRYV